MTKPKRPPVVHYRLSRGSPAIKVLTSGSLFLILAGIVIVLFYALDQAGLTPAKLAAHYAGKGEGEGAELVFALSYNELMRITHVHTFGMGMLLYIYGHMYTLTGARERTKVFWIGSLFAGLTLVLASMWLIAYASTVFTWLFIASFALSCLALGWMSIYVLYEIWFGRPARAYPPSEPVASGAESADG